MVILNKENERNTFRHRISKGSRFNQIYIPTEMNGLFEVGDAVEVRLLEKKDKIFYSSNLAELGEFKEKLIKQVFLLLEKFNNIKRAFFVGSFLTNTRDYNDIDLILVVKSKGAEKLIEKDVLDKIPLKFHIISFDEAEFENLLVVDPLIRNMLSYFVSNKYFKMPIETKLDLKHINFLLMMPKDVLKLNLESRIFYDCLRRLFAIEVFIKKGDKTYLKIEHELRKVLGENLYRDIRANKNISPKEISKIRKIILSRINLIEGIIKSRKNE